MLGAPRGPRTELRLLPEQTIATIEPSGLKVARWSKCRPTTMAQFSSARSADGARRRGHGLALPEADTYLARDTILGHERALRRPWACWRQAGPTRRRDHDLARAARRCGHPGPRTGYRAYPAQRLVARTIAAHFARVPPHEQTTVISLVHESS